jgi:hypothetical protein
VSRHNGRHRSSPRFYVRASLGIATACARQDNLKGYEAREAYNSVLQNAALNHGDPIRLEAASGLALECYAVEGQRVESDRLAERCETASRNCDPALRNLGMLQHAQGRTEDAHQLFKAAVDVLLEQVGEYSSQLQWHPDTIDAMAGVAAAFQAEGKLAEAEEGLRGLLTLDDRFLGQEHVDTLVISKQLAALVCSRNNNMIQGGIVFGFEDQTRVKVDSLPLHSYSGQATSVTAAVPLKVESSMTLREVLKGLWLDLPGLAMLHDLQLRGVLEFERETWNLFAVKALGAPCLRSVDLR